MNQKTKILNFIQKWFKENHDETVDSNRMMEIIKEDLSLDVPQPRVRAYMHLLTKNDFLKRVGPGVHKYQWQMAQQPVVEKKQTALDLGVTPKSIQGSQQPHTSLLQKKGDPQKTTHVEEIHEQVLWE